VSIRLQALQFNHVIGRQRLAELKGFGWIHGFNDDCGPTIEHISTPIHQFSEIGQPTPYGSKRSLFPTWLTEYDGLKSLPIHHRDVHHQTCYVIHSAGVYAARTCRLNEELQDSVRDDPSYLFCAVDLLPKGVIPTINLRNGHSVVLPMTTLGGADVPIAPSWIATLHLASSSKTLHGDKP
jgi:hypothetical protein